MPENFVSAEEVMRRIEERERDLEARQNKASKWYIGPLTTILILIAGLAVQWGMVNMTVTYLEDRVEKLETKVMELNLKQARDDTLIVTIKEDIAEIKDDVKILTKRKRY